ncbi:MAG: hypothetical protein ABSC06_31240 [Rhodopila sp.]
MAELPTDDDPPQAGFVIMGVVIAGNKNREVRIETFGMAATEHAVARLLDRSGFRADPVATMLEAHAALTEVDQDNGQRMFDLKNAQLPTATGAFLATPGRFGPDAAPLMVCRTWLPADQLFEDQAGTREAWRILLSHPTLP